MEQFLEWCNGLAISQAFRDSLYLFAITQCLHLVAITAFMGAMLIVDLRLLGFGVVRQSRVEVARNAQRILWWSGLAVLATGIPQFTTNALSYSRSPIFVYKMWLIAAAVVYTATVRRSVASADEKRLPSWLQKVVGAVSIVLWMGVTIGGRFITYYG